MNIPHECRFCSNVKSHKEPEFHYRCDKGRWDKPATNGKMIYRGISFVSIKVRSKLVKAAEKDCPFFSPISEKLACDLYPGLMRVYKSGYIGR